MALAIQSPRLLWVLAALLLLSAIAAAMEPETPQPAAASDSESDSDPDGSSSSSAPSTSSSSNEVSDSSAGNSTGNASSGAPSTTRSRSHTDELPVPVVVAPSTYGEVPAFYTPSLSDAARGVLVVVSRPGGSVWPLNVSFTVGSVATLLSLQVYRTAPFDSVAFNGEVYSTALVNEAPDDKCGVLRTAAPGNSSAIAVSVFGVAPGPQFAQSSCAAPYSFAASLLFREPDAVTTAPTLSAASVVIGGISAGNRPTSASTAAFQYLNRSVSDASPYAATVSRSTATTTSAPQLGATAAGVEPVIACDARDLTPFIARRGMHGTGAVIPCLMATGEPCGTVMDFQSRCAADAGCAGFTAALLSSTGEAYGAATDLAAETSYTEVALRMHAVAEDSSTADAAAVTAAQLSDLTAAAGTADVAVQSAFYGRPTTAGRSCAFTVGGASQGTAEFMVLQSSFEAATVRISRQRSGGPALSVATCGGIKPFATRHLGRSGQCGTYIACAVDVTLQPGDVVRAEPSTDVAQLGCEYSLSVIAVFTATGPAGTAAPPYVGFNTTGLVRTTVALRPSYIALDVAQVTLRVVVANVSFAALRVAQTRMACTSAGCPSTAIALSPVSTALSAAELLTSPSVPSAATCGGRNGFPQGAGLNAQCAAFFDCNSSLTAVPARSGVWAQEVALGVDVSALRAAGTVDAEGRCGGLILELWLKPSSGPVGFPLRGSDGAGTVAPAVLLPMAAVSAASDAAALLPSIAASALLQPYRAALVDVSATAAVPLLSLRNDPVVAVAVDWDSVHARVGPSVSGGLRALLNPNQTLACVVDQAQTPGAVLCRLPIPAAANAATVDVLQTDFAASGITITFANANGVTLASPASMRCGGGESFRGEAGLSGQCARYQTCRSGLITASGAGAAAAPAYLDIRVDAGVTNGVCPYAFAALVTFKEIFVSRACTASEFTCPDTGKCVQQTEVCDSVPNACDDNSDESRCGAFTMVETGYRPQESAAFKTTTSSTFDNCRRDAVLGGASAFYLGTDCVLLNATASQRLVSVPGNVTAPTAEAPAELYVASSLVTPASKYRRCSAVLHCSGNGRVTDNTTCQCECISGYTGASCGTLLQTSTPSTFLLALHRNATTNLALNVLQSALATALAGQVTVDSVHSPLPYDDTVDAFPFEVTAPTARALQDFTTAVFGPRIIASANVALAALGIPGNPVTFVFGVDAASAFSPVGTCTVTGGVVTGCPAPPEGRTKLLWKTVGVDSFSFSAAVPTTARRAAGTENITACAAGSDQTARGQEALGCRVSTCIPDAAGRNVSSSQSLSVTATAIAPSCSAPSMQLSATPLLSPAVTMGNAATFLTTDRTAGFLIGAIVAFVCGALALSAIGIAVFFVARALRRNAAELSAVKDSKAEPRDATTLGKERLGLLSPELLAALVAVIVVILCGAGFGTVLYLRSEEKSSNTAVTVSFFFSSRCSGRLASSNPRRATFIPTTGQCSTLRVLGAAEGPLFGAALCAPGATPGDAEVPRLVLARRMADCESQVDSLLTVSPNECVNATRLLPAEHGFMAMECVPKAFAQSVVDDVARANPVSVPRESVPVLNDAVTRHSLGIGERDIVAARVSDTAASSQTPTFGGAASVGDTVLTTTSFTQDTVAAVAASDFYVGDYSAARLLIQPDDAFDTAVQSRPVASELETQLQRDLTRLDGNSSVLRPFTPRDNDYPVGFVFGGFGTTDEKIAEAAGPGALRYYGVSDTVFDIGTAFAGSKKEEDGSAATMQLWLKASTTTRGFAFAVTDNYQDTVSRTSPILERLIRVAASGEKGDVPWFSSAWHVYSSLYVDGPSRSLQFLFADPGDSDTVGASEPRVVRATWDVIDMGTPQVFNGRWHRLTIGFRNEQGRFYAILAVDGVTELSSPKFRKCLSRRPTAVQELRDRTVPVLSASKSAVSPGGVLYVGYLNGAVQGVRSGHSYVTAPADVRAGPHTMRVHAAMPQRMAIEAVAIAMVLAAIAAIAYIVLTVVRIKRMEWTSLDTVTRQASRVYERTLVSLYTARYVPLPHAVVCEWLDVSRQDFVQIQKELSDSPASADGQVKLVRALWAARREHHADLSDEAGAPVFGDDYPTPKQWEALLKAERFAMIKNPKYDGAVDADGNPLAHVHVAAAIDDTGAIIDNAAATGADEVVTEALGAAAAEVQELLGEADAPDDLPDAPEDLDLDAAGDLGEGLEDEIPDEAPDVGEGEEAGPDGEDAGIAAQVSQSERDELESEMDKLKGLSIGDVQVTSVVLTTLTTLQSAGTYVSSFVSVPESYSDVASHFLGFLNAGFDFFRAIASDPLAGPLAQLAAVVLLLVGMAYVLSSDTSRFFSTVLRYRARRDMLELMPASTPAEVRFRAQLEHTTAMLQSLDPDFGSDIDERFAPLLQLVDLEDRCAVAAFAEEGAIGDELVFLANGSPIAVHLAAVDGCCGRTAVVVARYDGSDIDGTRTVTASAERYLKHGPPVKPEQDSFLSFGKPPEKPGSMPAIDPATKAPPSASKYAADGTDSGSRHAEGMVLKATDTFCARHSDIRLVGEEYTDVSPFSARRKCCAVVKGETCGCQSGMLYTCPHDDDDGPCGYALCDTHVNFSRLDALRVQITAQIHNFTNNGVMWLFDYVILTAALALYTPALRTCIMILGCHPVFQCEFGDCWADTTTKFVASAYLSVVVLVFFGVGFPIAVFVVLGGRGTALHALFTRPVYRGRYLEPMTAADFPEIAASEHQRSFAVALTRHFVVCTNDAAGAVFTFRAAFAKHWLRGFSSALSPEGRRALIARCAYRGVIADFKHPVLRLRRWLRRSNDPSPGPARPEDEEALVAEDTPSVPSAPVSIEGEKPKSKAPPKASTIDWVAIGTRLFQAGGDASFTSPDGAEMTATECLIHGAEADASNTDAWSYLGLSLLPRTTAVVAGRSVTPQQCFIAAAKADPDNTNAWNNLGVLLAAVSTATSFRIPFDDETGGGRMVNAVDCFTLASQVDPDNTTAWDNLQQILRHTNAAVWDNNGAPPAVEGFTLSTGVAFEPTVLSPDEAPAPEVEAGPRASMSPRGMAFEPRPTADAPIAAASGAEDDGAADTKADTNDARGATPVATPSGVPEPTAAPEEGEERMAKALDDSAAAAADSKKAESDARRAAVTQELRRYLQRERLDEVSMSEWRRFLSADTSVLANLYNKTPVTLLATVPVLAFGRFVLLLPSLLLEPSSSGQFVGIAIGELLFAVFFIVTEPFTCPWMSVTTMAGSTHQFALIAMQAFATARANDEDLDSTVGVLMVVTSCLYVGTILLVILIVMTQGLLVAKLEKRRADRFFERFGITRPSQAPIYVCPPAAH